MNIHEYQAKKIFKTFGINVPKGIIAYTPLEAKNAALEISNNGPWVVKAQIQSGSRDLGKFHDKRAGKKGGIRLSKTIDEVFENADEMLENLLVTNQTGKKGRLVSRIYIEEYIKTIEKFYIGLVVDWVSASTVLLIAPVSNKNDDNIVEMASSYPENILKINLGLQKELTSEQLKEITDFMESDVDKRKLKSFINKMLKLFYSYDATMLEINPIGIDKNGEIWALDAK